MWVYGSAPAPSDARVDPINTNKDSERTDNKFANYLINTVNCFCWNVINNKIVSKLIVIIIKIMIKVINEVMMIIITIVEIH